jgi:hypothetical protein
MEARLLSRKGRKKDRSAREGRSVVCCKQKAYTQDRSATENSNARRAGEAAGRTVPLRRLFQVSGKDDNLSALLCGHPLYLRFEPCRNVVLDHLCHNHPSDPLQPTCFAAASPCQVACSVIYLDADGTWKSQAGAGSCRATFVQRRCFMRGEYRGGNGSEARGSVSRRVDRGSASSH